MSPNPRIVNRRNRSQLLAGTFLVVLASVFFASLAFPGSLGVDFLLILAYSNLLATETVVLGYQRLRGSGPSTGPILSGAILSVLALPISVIYYIPLGVGCVVLVVVALRNRLSGGRTTREDWPLVAAMILWPAAMTATLILSGHIVPALVDPLFTGLSLIWAIIGFEVVIRAYDSSDHPNQELRLGKAVWIANLPVFFPVGFAGMAAVAISIGAIPRFGIWDQLLDLWLLTVGLPLAAVGSCNLLVATYRRWLLRSSGVLPA
jgi:hypothetical protein